MDSELAYAIAVIDRALLGQSLDPERAESLAREVEALNARVRAYAADRLDVSDEPASFQVVLMENAWSPPSET